MSIFDKLAFWKKHDDFELSSDFKPNEMGGEQIDTGLPPLDQGPGISQQGTDFSDQSSGFGQQGTGFGTSPDPLASQSTFDTNSGFNSMPQQQSQSFQPGEPPTPSQSPTSFTDNNTHQFKSPQMQQFEAQRQASQQPQTRGQQIAQKYIQGESAQVQQQQQTATMEVISLKLDHIRAQLDSMNERLKKLEQHKW